MYNAHSNRHYSTVKLDEKNLSDKMFQAYGETYGCSNRTDSNKQSLNPYKRRTRRCKQPHTHSQSFKKFLETHNNTSPNAPVMPLTHICTFTTMVEGVSKMVDGVSTIVEAATTMVEAIPNAPREFH